MLLGLCAFGGFTTWCLWGFGRSPERITVTAIVLNDADQQPVCGAEVVFHDDNHGMPIWVPRGFAIFMTGYRGGRSAWTDGKGKAVIRIPNYSNPKERAYCYLSVNPLTLPENIVSKRYHFPKQLKEGKLFEDDVILIRLVPKSSATPASPSTGDSKATPIDR
jgi:hypothetical protein